jgi:RNA polymerase sigma factor (sigma-70 family)
MRASLLTHAKPAESSPVDMDGWVLVTAPDAVAYAQSMLRDRAAAEDVVQDCYCRLLQKADVYDLPRDGRKLLFESVTNACINRATRARHIISLDATGTDESCLHTAVADKSAAPPERVLMDRELEHAIAAALAKLPLPQRAALELKSLGQSLQDIGETLEVSPNYAGVLIHRARQAMAEYLAPFLEERAG